MLPSSNPDARETFKWRYERACREFVEGGSEAVFGASLYCIGYRGARLRDEVNYQLSLRGVPKVVEQYKGGLPARAW